MTTINRVIVSILILLYPCNNTNILAFTSWTSSNTITSFSQYNLVAASNHPRGRSYNSRNTNISNANVVLKSNSRILSFVNKILYNNANPILQNTKQMIQTNVVIQHQIGMPRTIDNLIENFESKLTSKKLSTWTFFLTILLHQKKQLLRSALLRLSNTCIQSLPSIFIAKFLQCFETQGSINTTLALKNLFSLLAVLFCKMILENAYFYYTSINALEVRGILSGLLFDKSLLLPSGGDTTKKDTSGIGSTLNLLQIDTSVIENFFIQINTFWDGPLQILIYTSLLYHYLGSSVAYGIIVLLLSIPLNSYSLRLSNYLLQFENIQKDNRSKLTLESISNMKLLKFQAWEKSFQERIEETRQIELKRLRRRGILRALTSATTNAIPTIVLVVTFYHYTKINNTIKPSIIFTAISLFNQLRFPLLFYPMLMDSLANAKNSFGRIVGYLNRDGMVPYSIRNNETILRMDHGNFLWSYPTKDLTAALCNTTLSINRGEMVAVIGNVGSGKTALLKGLLGELVPVPPIVLNEWIDDNHNHIPTVILPTDSSISYCAQEAWLSKGTLRDAIVFGKEFEELKYNQAIYDAALDEDICNQKLSHDTNVGEGGSLLSGGQRARVALARALYNTNSNPIYLLDDVLSSLDVNVSRTVFGRLKQRFKKENATVVFVTNDIPLVARGCDSIILMGKVEGKSSCATIKDKGSYTDLVKKGYDLYNITHHEIDMEEVEEQPVLNDTQIVQNINKVYVMEDAAAADSDYCQSLEDFQNSNMTDIDFSIECPLPDSPKQKDRTNEISTNKTTSIATTTAAVPKSTYTSYLQSISNKFYFVAMITSFFMVNGSQFLQQLLISKWTNTLSSSTTPFLKRETFFASLVACSVSISLFLFLRSFFTVQVGLQASTYFHSNLLKTVFAAPISFFDNTNTTSASSGQIMNRFTKEMDVIDRSLPDGISSVLYCLFQIGFSMMALSGIITPFMLVPLSMLGILYVRIMRLFRPASRMYKRMESGSRSPVYTHFYETLKGIETIRSFPNSSRYYRNIQQSLVQTNLNNYHTTKVLDRWLSIRLESLGNVVVGMAALLSIFLKSVGRIQPGSAAFGLTQSLSVTGLLTWAVRCITEVETQMMSVQRITEMSNIPSSNNTIPKEYSSAGEAYLSNPNYYITFAPKSDHALRSTHWPWSGNIQLKHVSMKYDSSQQVILNDISLDIAAGTTVGIVGRTGSGKSSLLLTLFRLVEIENGGRICIDGVDIRSVDLGTLRSSLAVIPQNPVLFAGSLLRNLDTTGSNKITEEQAWEALKIASQDLYDQLKQRKQSLDAIQITEGGKNFSQGQRQILCLTRALLSNCRILVLDEATSSVDRRTDLHIQQVIQREFVQKKGVTVITVAHRLETILNYDNIAVLGDGGRLVEYGAPRELLRNRNGYLSQMVKQDANLKRDSFLIPSFIESENGNGSNVTILSEDYPVALS